MVATVLSTSFSFFFFFFFFFLFFFCLFVCFLLGDLHRSNFANFCHNLKQNHLSYLPMHKMFYFSHWLKNQIFSLFLIVKMNANYEEICRVGNLEAVFNKFSISSVCSICLKFSQYCYETSIIKFQ